MKKILILCLAIGMALCSLVGCVKTDKEDSSVATNQITEVSYWQEMVDNWCIVNYGDDWYGVITDIDGGTEDEGYITFTPTCRDEGTWFDGWVMATKYSLNHFYRNLNNE